MSLESNKLVVRRFLEEVVNTGRVEALDEFIDPDCVDQAGIPGQPAGIEGMKQHVLGVRTTFPDLHVTVEDQVAERDVVVTRVTGRGTHLGKWMGIAPTGKQVVIKTVNVDRLRNDKIVEHGGAGDIVGMLLQMGVDPFGGHPQAVNKALIHRYYEEMWNTWNFALVEELIAPTVEFRGSLGIDVSGRERFKDYMRTVQQAFPDFHNRVEELIAEGDRVTARLSYTGTHQGELFGIPATGQRVSYAGVALFRIAGNRIVEGWVLGDVHGLIRQLGGR